MGKSQGLIGNFNGKVGNMVGFKVSQSNNGTSQGVRIYQPVRKNPKTAAQAEQRAKYAPIFATYRALKGIIDRGQESQPYGNASRIAWLKKAFRSADIPWTTQGSPVEYPLGCILTSGTLNGFNYYILTYHVYIHCSGVTSSTNIQTVSDLFTLLVRQYPWLHQGDQMTIVYHQPSYDTLTFAILSLICDVNDTTPITGWSCNTDVILFEAESSIKGGSIIVSREGTHGEHLRSTSLLTISEQDVFNAPYDEASKQAAIESYMTSGAENLDWSEEPI